MIAPNIAMRDILEDVDCFFSCSIMKAPQELYDYNINASNLMWLQKFSTPDKH